MTPGSLAGLCKGAIEAGSETVTLVLPRPWKRPPGFPRGELLCENSNKESVYSFNAIRLLAWLAANDMVKVKAALSSNPAAKE